MNQKMSHKTFSSKSPVLWAFWSPSLPRRTHCTYSSCVARMDVPIQRIPSVDNKFHTASHPTYRKSSPHYQWLLKGMNHTYAATLNQTVNCVIWLKTNYFLPWEPNPQSLILTLTDVSKSANWLWRGEVVQIGLFIRLPINQDTTKIPSS